MSGHHPAPCLLYTGLLITFLLEVRTPYLYLYDRGLKRRPCCCCIAGQRISVAHRIIDEQRGQESFAARSLKDRQRGWCSWGACNQPNCHSGVQDEAPAAEHSAKMQPAAPVLVWSVCLSVGHSREPYNNG